MTLKAVIVDDEALAREGLRGFLDREPDITVLAECADGASAVDAIRSLQPDLVLLDVQMPACDGFEVLRRLEGAPLPVIIFVTAHDRYALEAFHAHALDYLLKPVEAERFQKAIERARAQILYDARRAVGDLAGLIRDLRQGPRRRDRIMVRRSGRIYFLAAEEILWIEATGNYARLHTGSGRHVIRESMTSLESTLDPERFVRIHRSTIVNLDHVGEIQPWFQGESVVILRDGTRLTLSRTYRPRLQERLSRPQ